MFRSFSVGAVCALLAVFLIAAIAKWAGVQPNCVVASRGAEGCHLVATLVSMDGVSVDCVSVGRGQFDSAGFEPSLHGIASARSTISSWPVYEGDTPYGGVLKFSTDASDLMRQSCAAVEHLTIIPRKGRRFMLRLRNSLRARRQRSLRAGR